MAGNKTCGCCDTSKSFNQFYKSPFEGDKGYLHICKTCCKKKLNEYSKIIGSDASATWLVLAELGVPFIQEVWKQVENLIAVGKNKPDLILQYLNYLSEMGIIVHGFWESDVMLDDICDKCCTESENNNINLKEEIKIWGKFLDKDGNADIEAYEILNRAFEKYTKDLEVQDENYEERIRDLCKCELRLRRANELGDGGEISKAQDSLNKQLALLKLNDFSGNKQSITEKMIERMAWNIENTKPAECEDAQIYKDFSKFEPVWKDIKRTLQNLVAGTREFPDVPKNEI